MQEKALGLMRMSSRPSRSPDSNPDPVTNPRGTETVWSHCHVVCRPNSSSQNLVRVRVRVSVSIGVSFSVSVSVRVRVSVSVSVRVPVFRISSEKLV